MKNILYIGLNGYAGSGKDTVAKMLHCILNYGFTKESTWKFFVKHYSTLVRPYATYNAHDNMSNNDTNFCMCIAFADRLKQVCAKLFGIPVDYLYSNKDNSWICINKDFKYTENKPNINNIISAEEYYNSLSKYKYSDEHYYMSLRELLVYVGTYICQESICENVFINSVNNTIQTKGKKLPNLKYIICTDVRFIHEYDYIKANNGIMINIKRDTIKQATDIAEHDLDTLDQDNYDFVIENNGTYEELFDTVWDLVYNEDNQIFLNNTITLETRDETINSYIRVLIDKEDEVIGQLCSEFGMTRILHNNGQIIFADLVGGPKLQLNDVIEYNENKLVLSKMEFNNDNKWILYLMKQKNS